MLTYALKIHRHTNITHVDTLIVFLKKKRQLFCLFVFVLSQGLGYIVAGDLLAQTGLESPMITGVTGIHPL